MPMKGREGHRTLRLLVALSLAAIYAVPCLTIGGVHGDGSFLSCFFVPAIVMVVAGVVFMIVTPALPLPWRNRHGTRSAPRDVRLSWHAAVGVPSAVPALFLPANMFAFVVFHLDPRWPITVAVVVVVLAVGLISIRRSREYRLVRSGEVAMAIVDRRENTDESTDRIFYHFSTPSGRTVTGRARYLGYNVAVGSEVPVFFDAADPRRQVAGCNTWFEPA